MDGEQRENEVYETYGQKCSKIRVQRHWPGVFCELSRKSKIEKELTSYTSKDLKPAKHGRHPNFLCLLPS